ncbi:hypothetical protein [Aquisphaera giovannonii]|uniref:hypothetical protein n=1 Tax=Aquisphaera giovannonii TaxID=406548 RepID=UPI001AF02947|nr:hypothetical protein [Aquisphaera giovannonii]
MRIDQDGLPHVDPSATGLGVRPGVDVDLDRDVVLQNGKGMSVNPDWRFAPLFRIPSRLRHLCHGARGPDSSGCFRYGSGPFEAAPFAEGLSLEPDSPTHANVTPITPMTLEQYQDAIARTRPGWTIDEA